MGEEGGASNAGSSGILKFKDNIVKITKDHKKTIFVGCKSLELILIFIGAVLEGYKAFKPNGGYGTIPQYKDLSKQTDMYFRIICTAFNGIFIFNLILLITYLMGEQLSKKLLSIFSLIAAIFCLAAGIILISDNGDSNKIENMNGAPELLVSGIFAILAALTFAIESIITYIYAK